MAARSHLFMHLPLGVFNIAKAVLSLRFSWRLSEGNHFSGSRPDFSGVDIHKHIRGFGSKGRWDTYTALVLIARVFNISLRTALTWDSPGQQAKRIEHVRVSAHLVLPSLHVPTTLHASDRDVLYIGS